MKATVLFLTLNVFDSTGGVQSVCRTLSHLLSRLLGRNFKACSMYDHQPDLRYVSSSEFTGYAGIRSAFILNAVIAGINSKTIIISHINLLFITILIKIFNRRSKLIMIAH